MSVCKIDGCTDDAKARGLCSKHYQAAWERGDLSPIPRVIKRVCPPDHKHDASTTCYRLHGCRCEPCYQRRSNEERRRARDIAYGTYDPGWVEAAAVRDHVLALSSVGIGRRRLAELAGVSESAIQALRTTKRGLPVRRVTRAVGDAILAVPLFAEPARGVPTLARGTHRRLQALIARGWSEMQLSRELGLTSNNMPTWFDRDRVSQDKADAVAALYERLWDQHPPTATPAARGAVTRSLNFARRNGWVPPLAWDDIDNDDAPAQPDDDGGIDHVAVTLALAGEHVSLTPAERRECVRRLHAERWSDGRIADTIGCASKTVERIRDELGLAAFAQSDLIDRSAA